MPRPAETAIPSERLSLTTYLLAAGVFLMGTTEFVVAGILPQVAEDLDRSVAQSGMMITVFALGMIVGTPAMAVLTMRLPARVTLTQSLLTFAVGHVIVAMTSSFAIILAARFITALATGAFWAVAAVVAARSAGPAASSRALGVVLGGGMLANVVGVPLGTFAGQAIGWRGPFWVLAAAALTCAFVIHRSLSVPADEGVQPTIAKQVRSLRDGRLWSVFAACAIVCGSSFAVYSFIAPLLTSASGLPPTAVPLVLAGYGVGAFAGTNLGGRLGGHHPYRVLCGCALLTFVAIVGLYLFAHLPVVAVALIVAMGIFGMATNPVLIGLAVKLAKAAPTLASALCTSSFNLGTAVGSWLAGMALESSLGATGPALVGACIAALYVVPIAVLVRSERSSSTVIPAADQGRFPA